MADDEWDPLADPAESEPSTPREDQLLDVLEFPVGEDELDLAEAEAAYASQMLEALPLVSLDTRTAAEGAASLNGALEALPVFGSVGDDETIVRNGRLSLVESVGSTDDADADAKDAYEGPVYTSGEITADFCRDLIQWQQQEKILDKRYAYSLVQDVIDLLKGSSTVVDVQVPMGGNITVCGDVHGQYYDLLNIWEMNGPPSEDNPYIFNGDFVDRGSFSLEVMLALFAWKLTYPRHFHLARGNHESRTMNRIYGFEGEVRSKYDGGLYALFCEAFCLLPLCHIINNQVFVVHGGLFSQNGVTLDEIRSIDRICEPLDEGLMVEMLWSDPQPARGRAPSKRGVGIAFGEDVTEDFLTTNDLKLVIRSHELCEDGYSIEHGGRLITVFSAPNYCDQMGNKGAFIRLDGETLTPKPSTFAAVAHPPIQAMQYASPLPFFGGVKC